MMTTALQIQRRYRFALTLLVATKQKGAMRIGLVAKNAWKVQRPEVSNDTEAP